MKLNMTLPEISEHIAETLQVIAPPARIAILIAIGRGEACVCHLEAILGWRQAYISQHMMALRKAEILSDRREGRYVYYRLKDPAILALIRDAAVLAGLTPADVDALANPDPGSECECPHCVPSLIPLESLIIK
jgi:DNA-binding transcriptional ArsR family regulator